jgi:hypothetical protein
MAEWPASAVSEARHDSAAIETSLRRLARWGKGTELVLRGVACPVSIRSVPFGRFAFSLICRQSL